jgi:hypothetical protein
MRVGTLRLSKAPIQIKSVQRRTGRPALHKVTNRDGWPSEQAVVAMGGTASNLDTSPSEIRTIK